MAEWECHRCTLQNPPEAPVCGACCAQRLAPPAAQAPAPLYPPVPAPAPPPARQQWLRLIDAQGRVFYYNETTQVTRWDPPPELAPAASPPPPPPPQQQPVSRTPVAPHAPQGHAPGRAPSSYPHVPGQPQAHPHPQGQRATGGGGANSPPPGRWTCGVCTLEHDTWSAKCDVCETPNPSPRPVSAASSPSPHSPSPPSSAPISREGSGGRGRNSLRRPTLTDPNACTMCTSTENAAGWAECAVCGAQRTGPTPDGHRHSVTMTGTINGTTFNEQEELWLKKTKEIVDDQKNKACFVDETFPPDMNSLYGDGPIDAESFGTRHGSVISAWRRLHNTVDRQGLPMLGRLRGQPTWTLAPRDPGTGELVFSADAITQGMLGDCWFLSALAVVCTRPELIRRIFITKELSPKGVYALRFWHNGVWTPVIIDDHVPVTDHGCIAFAAGKERQLWPSLVEKAYAKLFGSFRAICGGNASDALTDLTGAPSHKINFEEDEKENDAESIDMDWVELVSCAQRGFLMAASCGKSGCDRAVYDAVGLISNHCYTVLQVLDTNGVRLLQLRNPWGLHRGQGWQGDYAADWARIPAATRAKVQGGGEGTFWISFIDFLQYFSCVDVCKSFDDWQQTSVSDWFQPMPTMKCDTSQFSTAFTIRTTTPTWVFVSVVQRDSRGAEAEYSYKDLNVIIMRVTKMTMNLTDPQHLEFIAGKVSHIGRMCTVDAILHHPGTYIVIPFSLLNKQGRHPYTLSLWSSKPLQLQKYPLPSLHPVVSGVHKMCCAGDSDLSVNVTRDVDHPFPGVTLSRIKGTHGIWFFARNDSSSTFWCSVDCNGSSGVVSTRDELVTVDTVQPGAAMLLQVLNTSWEYGSFSYRFRMKFKLGRLPVEHRPPQRNLHEEMYTIR